MEVLDIKKALEMVDGSKDLLKILIDSYISDKILDEKKLRELESLEDTTEAAKYVHYFKGAARQLCAEVLAFEGQKLEDYLRKKTPGNLDELNKSFVDAYAEAIGQMKKEVNSLQ